MILRSVSTPSESLIGSGGAAQAAGAEPLFSILIDWERARVVCLTEGCNHVCQLRDAPALMDFVCCPRCHKPARVQNLRRLVARELGAPL